MNYNTLKLILTLILLPSCINSQQNYTRGKISSCSQETTPCESHLYTCNGQYSSCRAFLIFRAKSPYNTAVAIADHTSSEKAEITRINNITTLQALSEGQPVVVPVNCSCLDENYQASTTYQILPQQTYFIIAKQTFQGLSTCDELKRENTYSDTGLLPGQKLRVPLRCACPTAKQAAVGVEFLLTYLVGEGDNLPALSKRFNVSLISIRQANSFRDEFVDIEPFTTILIPLPSEPSHVHGVSGKFLTNSPSLPPPVNLKSRTKRVVLIVGITAGGFSLLILLPLVIVFFSRKKRAQAPPSRGGNAKNFSPQELILEIAKLDRALKVYEFSEIKKATRNFGSKRWIENHGYRGNFMKEVFAVKKINTNVNHEMKMLYKINHFNIVKLHGFCQHKDELYLVYEFMANGSLREWLSRRDSREIESWSQLIRIALDVANGLLYLHNFANPAYVHNDVTSSNILLDINLRAKIANFSHAREANCNGEERVVGSRGYMAPEFLDAGPVTAKVDVYAFGVVLLEMVTDKCAVFEEGGRERLLTTTIAAVMDSANAEGELCRFVGRGLDENGGMEYVVQVVKLSLSCLMREPLDRPHMVEVVSVLLKMQSIIHKASVRS